MSAEKRKRGRPMIPAKPGQRYALGLRVNGEIKQRIEERAQRSGRTQSQEVEALIEQALDREALLSQTLELAYGRPLAGLLMAIGRAMHDTGEYLAFLATFDLAARERWLSDQYAYDQAVAAARAVLDGVRPAEPSETGEKIEARFAGMPEHVKAAYQNFGEGVARGIVEALNNPERGGGIGDWAGPVRAMIGHVPNPELAVTARRDDHFTVARDGETMVRSGIISPKQRSKKGNQK